MEDEEVEITVTATIQNNLSVAELGNWDLTVGAVRYFDADGVATTDITTGDIDSSVLTNGGFGGPAATFNIQVAGQDEELKFSLASGNPDSADIVVDENKTTNDVTVLEYKIQGRRWRHYSQ